jgi:hypothetical protein
MEQELWLWLLLALVSQPSTKKSPRRKRNRGPFARAFG